MSRRDRQEVIHTLTATVRESQRLTDALDEAAVHKLDINRTDGKVLDVLSAGPMAASQIAAACHLTTSAMTTALDRLEKRDLVARRVDPQDRRRVMVEMTPLAFHLTEQIYGPLVGWASELFSQYSTEELAFIAEFLGKGRDFHQSLIESVREMEIDWDVPDSK